MPAHGGTHDTEPGGVRPSDSCPGNFLGVSGSSSLARAGVVLDPARPELSPHDLGQRAAGGFAQVGNPEFRRVKPVSGSH